jgi:hypothetical protein
MFSTMAHRSLATPHSHEVFGTRAALAGRQTLASWHSRFPSIIPHIREYLRRARSDGPATLSQHSPLFPILIIIRSLRWSSEGDDVADMLFPVVEPYLGSVEWQVREVAAQALSSLLSPAAALEKAKVTATRVSHDTDDYNTLHGRLLFLRRLISDVLSWSEAGDTDKKMLELRLRDALQVHVDARAVIPKEILACLNAYAAETSLVSPAFLPKAKRSALSFLARSTYTPGLDLLHDAAAQTVLLDATTSDAITLLAPTMAEDAQLAALDAIETHSRLQTTETLTALLRLCTAGAGAAVLTRAYAVLAAWPASPAADTAITALAEHLWRAVASRCVPLREAALVALGRVTAVAPLADRLRALADRLAAASDENKVRYDEGSKLTPSPSPAAQLRSRASRTSRPCLTTPESSPRRVQAFSRRSSGCSRTTMPTSAPAHRPSQAPAASGPLCSERLLRFGGLVLLTLLVRRSGASGCGKRHWRVPILVSWPLLQKADPRRRH